MKWQYDSANSKDYKGIVMVTENVGEEETKDPFAWMKNATSVIDPNYQYVGLKSICSAIQKHIGELADQGMQRTDIDYYIDLFAATSVGTKFNENAV